MGFEAAARTATTAIHQLYHYLDGELTDERRTQIAEHLDFCAPCAERRGVRGRAAPGRSPTAARTTSPTRSACGSRA